MRASPSILSDLEACGVTQVHLQALLTFLRCQENGIFQWHAHQGRFHHCELRVSFSAQPAQVERISQAVLGEEEGRESRESCDTRHARA